MREQKGRAVKLVLFNLSRATRGSTRKWRGQQQVPIALQCFERERLQAFGVMLVDPLEYLTPHARIPETSDMSGDALYRDRMIGLGVEEIRDIVRHLHETVGFHQALAFSCAGSRLRC
jgi:hypothetical protein